MRAHACILSRRASLHARVHPAEQADSATSADGERSRHCRARACRTLAAANPDDIEAKTSHGDTPFHSLAKSDAVSADVIRAILKSNPRAALLRGKDGCALHTLVRDNANVRASHVRAVLDFCPESLLATVDDVHTPLYFLKHRPKSPLSEQDIADLLSKVALGSSAIAQCLLQQAAAHSFLAASRLLVLPLLETGACVDSGS